MSKSQLLVLVKTFFFPKSNPDWPCELKARWSALFLVRETRKAIDFVLPGYASALINRRFDWLRSRYLGNLTSDPGKKID